MSDFSNPIFHDEEEARKWLEARVWPKGPVCPHCKAVDQATLMKGKSHRAGLYQCNDCREPFTVTVGTLYERSKVPLNKWLAATHLMMASKKGMSALQISRMLDLPYKTTWFLCHRIRESVKVSPDAPPMGGATRSSKPTKPMSAARRRTAPPASPRQRKRSSRLSSATATFARFMSPTSTAKTLKPIIEKQVEKAPC